MADAPHGSAGQWDGLERLWAPHRMTYQRSPAISERLTAAGVPGCRLRPTPSAT